MSEFRLEPPTPVPPRSPTPDSPSDVPKGSLASGVGLAWLIMLGGEALVFLTNDLGRILGGMLLPPVAIIVWAIVLFARGKPRTGKGMLLGLLSIIAVLLMLVAACFGLMSNVRWN